MPTNAPGLKQIFSYYTTTVKLTAEGDVHLSDEALSSLGTTLEFLRTALFGAITQIYDPPSHRTRHDKHITRPPEQESDVDLDPYAVDVHSAHLVHEENDPHIPIKPARRRSGLNTSTQDTPDTLLQDSAQHPQKARLIDIVPIGYFAAGGLSGITSRTATAPLDRLKVYLIAQTGTATEAVAAVKQGAALQATKASASTLWNACKDLWAAGGIRSLFAGMTSLQADWRT